MLAFTRRILGMRARQAETRTIFGIIVVLVASGVLVALLDAELAGILQRYYADFSFMFLAAAVLLCFVVNEQLAERAALHDLMLKLLLVLVGVSVAYSACSASLRKPVGTPMCTRGPIRGCSMRWSSGAKWDRRRAWVSCRGS